MTNLRVSNDDPKWIELCERARRVDDPRFLLDIDSIVVAEERQGDIHCALRLAEVDADRRRLTVLWNGIENRVKATFLPARDYDKKLDALHLAITEAFGCFKPHVPAEVWQDAEKILEEGFSKARLRDSLR